MALTLNQLVGFETGGLEEAGSTTGTPDATEAVIVRSGDRALRLDGAATEDYAIGVFDEVVTQGSVHIFGFGVYFVSGVTPSSAVVIVNIVSTNPSTVLDIELQTDGTLHLIDSNGALAINGTITLKADQWHFIEIKFEYVSSSASEMWVDGNSAGTGTADDFVVVGSIDELKFASTSALDGDIIFDDFYWLSDVATGSDRLGPGWAVIGFQGWPASSSADFDNAGVAGGDNIEVNQI